MPPEINRNLNRKFGTYQDYSGARSDLIFPSVKQQKIMRYGTSGNYGYPDFPANRDVGQDFYLEESYTSYGGCPVGVCKGRGPYDNTRYYGEFFVDGSSAAMPPLVYSPSAWGPEAYRRMKPTQPSFQGLNAIYELKDLPGMLRNRFHKNGLKDLANFHLALQFGWIPLLNDVANLIITQKKLEKRLAWLLRNNGKPIRTRVDLSNSSNATVLSDGEVASALYPAPPYIFMRWPHQKVTLVTGDRVWASARFRYWLPAGPGEVVYKDKLMRRLYGFQPTPSVIYNMIPWTWLIDWFSNAGDCVSNLDAGVADRLAADHFYCMREVYSTRLTEATGWFQSLDNQEFSANGRSQATWSVKARAKGDPFGWNSDESTLNAMQLSILGALGLSRVLR
jgi:hypothetical protein